MDETTIVLHMAQQKKIINKQTGKELKVPDERHFHFEHRPPSCNKKNTILDRDNFFKGGAKRRRFAANLFDEAQEKYAELDKQ